MTKRLRLKLAAVLAAALAILLLAALTFTWESTTLSRAVFAALSGPDLKLEAGAVRLSILRGVLLREVKLHARLEGGVFDLEAAELQLSHRFWRLLAGEVAVDEIVLSKPEMVVVWDAPTPPQRPAKGKKAPALLTPEAAPGAPEAEDAKTAGGLALAMKVSRLAIEGGSFSMSEQGADEEMVRFEGLYLELGELAVDPKQASVTAGLSGRGAVHADRLISSGVVASGVEGNLAIGGGKVEVTELTLPVDFGTIVIPQLALDLGRDPYYFALVGGGDPLRTARLLGAASGFGNSKLDFAVDGDGSPRGGPRGRGTLAVEGGELGDMPILAGLERLLVGTELIGRRYEPFVVAFELRDGDQVTLAPFAIVAGNLRLGAAGRVDLAGPLDLHLEVSLPREDVTVKEIPREVLEALTDVDGRVKLPILIAGTIDKPALRFDTRAWAGLAGRRLAAEALRRLFGD